MLVLKESKILLLRQENRHVTMNESKKVTVLNSIIFHLDDI